ncbi:winged helix-turn-helix domain-containing protein [Pseudoalteromonas sp.]|uniref:winged helix-turn-helix domain-containing protein n=1 Tax=Pseudoalteromonas sp. TaxID=53249 RepID=UPI003563CABC
MMNSAASYYLGRVEVNPLEHTLVCNEVSISLQPKFIELLGYLAQQQPELLTRQQIIEHVWDGNSYVGEKALTNAIWHLRKAFKELDSEQEYIETVRKSGYRLLLQPEYSEQREQVLYQVSSRQIKWFCFIIAMLISVSVAWIWWPKPQQMVYQEPELITQYPGRELFPSISNDGRYVVYSWRQMDRQIDLYRKDLEQPDLLHTKITHTPGSESRSVWAHDDSKLYYYRRLNSRCEVVSINLNDFTIEKQGECSNSASSDVAISPDGKLLAYVGIDPENPVRGIYIKELNTELPAKRIRCNQCELGESEAIAFGSLGKRLAISRNLDNGNEDIFIYNLEDKTEKRVVTGLPDIRGLAWQPNSEIIVFSAVEHGNRHGYELDLTTLKQTNLNIEGFSYPEFDRAGNLYYHDWKIDTSIMRLELDTDVAASPFPLIQSEFNFRFPDYSEAAEKIAFISNESGFDEIWIASLEGADRKQLTQLKYHAHNPVWSPDGKFIAFTANNGEKCLLFVLNVTTYELKQIKTDLNYYSKPRWSHNSTSLYSVYSGDVYRINIANGDATRITAGRHAVEVSENKLIVFKRDNGFWQVSLNGERVEEKPLIKNLDLANSTGWHVTEQGIYYFKVRGHDYRLSFYDFETKQDSDVLRVPERSFSRSRGMSFVPSRKWLLFTGYESPQVDIKRMRKDFN